MAAWLCVILVTISLLNVARWSAATSFARKSDNKRPKSCTIQLSHYASLECKLRRKKEVAMNQMFYRFSGPESDVKYPHLDHPSKTVMRYFMVDKFHSHWFNLHFLALVKNNKDVIAPFLVQKYRRTKITSLDNYTKISNEVRDAVLSSIGHLPYFKFPSRSYKYFTDITKEERFKEDKYFVQQRLAGLNPVAIRKVAHKGEKGGTPFNELFDRLNKHFPWEEAVVSITKDYDINESIAKNKVYVVEYPMLNGIQTMPDLLKYDRPFMKMKEHSSPIALFAVDPDKQLRIVAIQNSSTPAGHVHTPVDGILWNISKAQLQISDGFVGQMFEHLVRTHFRMEPLCIAIHRHLSHLHPLHEILKYHCRGLLAVNANGVVVLLKDENAIRSIFGYGNEGGARLISQEYPKMTWDDIDLEVNIKERGMGDNEQVPYYPYRDDGRKINKVIGKFANKFVNRFYKLDSAIEKDFELQAMMNDLSTKIKGLPAKFETKTQLSTFIRQTIWIVVHHSAVNFPVGEYLESPAKSPTKLYESQLPGKDDAYVDMLAGPILTVLQASLANTLGVLHYDALFDYWAELKSIKLSRLVREAYEDLQRVEKDIDKENEKRYKKGQLTNPFMVPSWMPNSIST